MSYALDPPDIADREEEQPHAAEEARAARWDAFVAWASQASIPVLLDDVSKLMRGQLDPYYAHRGVDERIAAFADAEGWDGVLLALSRAIRETRR